MDSYEKSLQTLELPAVLALLAAQAVSETARAQAMALRPSGDRAVVATRLGETSAAASMMVVKGSPSFSGVKDVRAALQRADMGGALNTRELLDIAGVLQAARCVRSYGTGERQDKTSIDYLFSALQANRFLEEKIFTSITGEDEIADSASSELASIRRLIRAASARVHDALQKIISSPSYAKALQEPIITMRSERYVVPVKAEHKGAVPGLVHDVSASGATLFIEPMAAVKANNELRELRAREKTEIERILAEFSAECAAHREDISNDFDVLVRLDLIFAKAKLAYQLDAIAPELTDKQLQLRRARHPLLPKDTAVPIDVSLGGEFDTLVITGPNTGGKTVSLKTLGLLSLMAASGLHIPANEQSEIGLFEHVYADIGDEQSIEQSLSTFSAHMKTIVSIMDCCGQGDLVLFDELGAGTDPVEGAALAVAVIGYARQMGACVAATTHYAELKTFALTTDGVENASCEFDVKSLQPTYRLLTGIPGKSNAFAIAARLGLQPTIIERAKEQVSTEDARFEDVLAELERERRRVEQMKEEAQRMRSAAQSERDKMRAERDAAEDRVDKMMESARGQADNILKNARMTAETVFDELETLKKKAQKKNADQNLAAAKAALRGVITQTENEQRRGIQKRVVEADEVRPVQKGDRVRLLNVGGVIATVLAPADRDGSVQVQAGPMKMTVKENELRLVEEKKNAPKPKPQPRRDAPRRELNIRSAESEVDVRGMSAEEALFEVDNFLSRAIMAGLPSVTVIHGKGTGVLRTAVQQHLRKNKRVKSVRSGVYGEGEQGVTIVELR